MIKKNPETYNELRTVHNLMQLNSYYKVSQEFLDEAYDFIMLNPNNTINCGKTDIRFVKTNGETTKTFETNHTSTVIDGLIVSSTSLTIIPHYNLHSYSGGGGSSSNNNNNNNNNNH